MHTQGGRWPKELIEALAKAGKAGNEQAIEQMKVLLYDSFPCHLVYPYAVTIDFERERFPYPKVYELLQRFVDSVEKDGPVIDRLVLEYVVWGVKRFLNNEKIPWPAQRGDPDKIEQQRKLREKIVFLHKAMISQGLPEKEVRESILTRHAPNTDEKTYYNALKRGKEPSQLIDEYNSDPANHWLGFERWKKQRKK